jgi:hypothetical protein
VEAAHGDGDACLPKRRCDVESARILVRLNANDANQSETAIGSEAGN